MNSFSNKIDENELLSIIMQAPVGIVILKGEGMMVEMANDTYLAIVDKKASDFIGKSLYESLPEVKERVSPILSNILKTGIPFFGNEFNVILNRFGKKEDAYFNFVYQPLKEKDETVTGVIVVANDVTKQVITKQILEEKEAQFRNMVRQSPIPMTIFRGEDYVIEMANETMLTNIWRKTPEEVINKKLIDVFPELKEQKFPDLLKKVMTTGVAHTEKEAMAIVNSHDGSRKYYLDYEYAPLKDVNGKISGLLVTVNDVTDKVQARVQIENAEKRYRQLIETLPVAMFTIDAEGFVDIYNQAAVTLWDRKPVKGQDKWCGSHGLIDLEGNRVKHEECPMAVSLRENRSIITEAYIERPNGSLRHVVAHPQPIQDEEGHVSGAVNVLIDITDIKNTEKALRNSEQKFRLLADSMPEFVWTATPDGEMNYFSKSVYEYSGLSQNELNGMGWQKILHEEDKEKSTQLWKKTIASGEDFQCEHRFRRHDGEYRWQLSRAVPQRNAEGKIQMWVGSSTDINTRKLFSDELEIQVAERTQDLHLMNENLQRSNNELLQFAYVASHDLQEPLRKIQIFISRLQEENENQLNDKGKDYIKRIETSSTRAQRLINDLLSFSKTNTIDKNFELINLETILEKVIDNLNELIVEHDVSIESEPLPTIRVIDFQIEQLFTNLITNAIKFSKANEKPQIKISCNFTTKLPGNDRVESNIPYYKISFEDNGIGFESEFSEKIFLVFQRLHSRDSYEGTGIGLAICKRIVENHGGIITAKGNPGKGASFSIFLPAKN